MKSGTPGFKGERLREAREARGLNGAQLAELIDVSRSAVSNYEHNKLTPAPETMRRIVDVLRLPTAFFLRPPTAEESDDRIYWWRSQATATERARKRGRRRCAWYLDLFHELGNYVSYQDPDFPAFEDIPDDPYRLTDAMVEDAASRTRRAWELGDGPISNMVWLLENHGVLVACFDLTADPLSGFSVWADDRPIVVLNSSQACARLRFSAAHELAHLILHRGVDKRRFGNEFSAMEDQANQFAGAFLLPAQTFSNEVYAPSLDAFRVLKERWKVSIQAMIARASSLGIHDKETTERLWKQLSAKRWRRNEPLDDEMPTEHPRLIRQALEALKRHDPRLAIEVRDRLTQFYTESDIESLGSLPRGFLDFENPKLAQVIPFPKAPPSDDPTKDTRKKRPS